METFDELYYREPYSRVFDATVTSCSPRDDCFAIELDQTAFYPTGGGQPGDCGTLTLGDREDQVIAHVREAVPGEGVAHLSDAPLPVGAHVHGLPDWAWRRNNMEAHAGEHMASGIAHVIFGYDNVGFYMDERYIEADFNGILRRTRHSRWSAAPTRSFARTWRPRRFYPTPSSSRRWFAAARRTTRARFAW